MQQLIAPGDGLLLVGSCFTDHIGGWLKEMWLPVCTGPATLCSNPWGVLFNPASIAKSLLRISTPSTDDFPLVERGGKYYSFAHHGQFAGTDPCSVRRKLLAVDREAGACWQQAKHVLVTFGTAWVYERHGEVVANCHKFPAGEFVRRRLSVEEIVDEWKPVIESGAEKQREAGPVHFIFTVSPIRHIGDGLHENQLSKSTLLLAIAQLQQLFPDQVDYLPVYELFMDDLRDYRFYADDLVHPATLGIEAVKELVSDCCFTRQMKEYVAEATPIVKALAHRPSDPESEQHRTFIEQQQNKQKQLLAKYESRR